MYPNNNCNDCPPCPSTITPLPLPDLSGLCGDQYNATCVIYTGPNIECLGITTGLTFVEILNIFNNKLCLCCTPVCFTFGSGLCDSAPDGTQVLVYAAGIHNDKPYFSFNVCNTTQVFWFNVADNLWYNSAVLGVPNVSPITLDNNSQYLPISNTTNYLWNNVDNNNSIYILQSTLNDCPEYKICFHLQITVNNIVYNFYNYVAPIGTPFDTGDHPQYGYTVTILGNPYLVSIFYDSVGLLWRARVNGVVIGTLPSTTFYPFGNWVPNPLNPGSFFVSAILGVPCVQPPDVDCVLECGEYSDCIGGTQTRTCVVVTPPAGNGAPCGPLVQTIQCTEPPVCFPPFDIVVTETGSCVISGNVIVAFTAASGASTHTITYTINGVAQAPITQASSPFLLPYVCDEAVYAGTIATTCTNTVISSATPFSFTTRASEIINRNERFTNLPDQFGHSIRPDGRVVFFSLHNGTPNDGIRSYELTTPWDISTINLANTTATPQFNNALGITQIYGHRFQPNGMSVFVVGLPLSNVGCLIAKLTLGVAWDLTSFTTVNVNDIFTFNLRARGIDFNANGTRMYLTVDSGVSASVSNIVTFQLPAAYTINNTGGVTEITPRLVIPGTTATQSLIFQNNGNFLFTSEGSSLVRRTLLTPYDLNTVVATSAVQLSPTIVNTPGNFYSISFRDGCKVFISSYQAPPTFDRIYAFELTCLWDISSGIIITP